LAPFLWLRVHLHLLNLQNLHSILLLGFNLQDQQLRHHHRHQFY
jgi:hypothetical protein